MKAKIHLFLFLFLAACAGPAKLMEKGNYEKAFFTSSKKLSKGKLKGEHIDVLVESFYQLNERDISQIERLKESGQPRAWIKIFNLATDINDRQHQAEIALRYMQSQGYNDRLNFYPVEPLLAEARDNCARYFYAQAQQYIPAARNQDRMAARSAWDQLDRCQDFIPGYENSHSLLTEMRELGTTHVLLNPVDDPFNFRVSGDIYSTILDDEFFPMRTNWQVVHLDQPAGQALHYRVDWILEEVYASGEERDRDQCRNSVEVEDGYTIKREWDARDSVWIEVKEPVFKTVSATVLTIEQEKYAEVEIEMEVINLRNNQTIDFNDFAETSVWQNVYSQTSGDRRALNGACAEVSGSWCFPPSDQSLILDAAEEIGPDLFYRLRELNL